MTNKIFECLLKSIDAGLINLIKLFGLDGSINLNGLDELIRSVEPNQLLVGQADLVR